MRSFITSLAQKLGALGLLFVLLHPDKLRQLEKNRQSGAVMAPSVKLTANRGVRRQWCVCVCVCGA